jgi:hypothetical protein
MASFIIERTINVPMNKVWQVLGDFGKSPGPSVKVTVIKEGNKELFGVGCERTIAIGKNEVIERLESANPPHSLSYAMLKGAPVKDYVGKVNLYENGKATNITWTFTFRPSIPGIGWLVAREIKKSINTIIDELEEIS